MQLQTNRAIRFYLSDDPSARRQFRMPCRMDVFGSREIGKGKRRKVVRVGWQGWNPDSSMERQMARLDGAGSFYWPGAIRVLSAAKAMMQADATIDQVKIETISGMEIGRVYR